MNTSINVTGMTVTTKVSSSLQIAASNEEALFSNSDLQQTRSALLEPASTVNGQNFFYTTNAKANGDASSDQYASYAESTALYTTQQASTGKTNFDSNFNTAYGYTKYDGTEEKAGEDVAFGYIDYSFYLKANIVGDAQKIAMDRCNILYNDGALQNEWAWRVALFSHEVAANTNEADATTAVEGNLVSILDLEKSKNQNEVTATKLAASTSTSGYFEDPQLTKTPTAGTADGNTVYYKGSGDSAPKAISGAAVAPSAVLKPNLPANVASGVTGPKIYKVVVRLWLEGEDVSCTSSTFATLTKSWSLNISFKLGADDGATVISNTPGMDFTQH